VPGFIDIHVQGAGGCDILDGTGEALRTVSRTLARFGVTGFCATTIFRPSGSNKHLSLIAQSMKSDTGGARLLGVHLEGPFISPEKRGMIQIDSICTPSPSLLDRILYITKGALKIMTLAPELPGSQQIIQRLRKNGIVPALGHTRATFEQTREAIQSGVSHVTHLFNAMPAMHHREPGPLVAVFRENHVTAQIIPDGVHIHPAVLALAYSLLGAQRCISISDGICAMGLSDGKYSYNGVEFESKNGTPRYADGTLISTSLGLSQLLPRLMAITGCTEEDAVMTVTSNPAKLLGLERRMGRLADGADGDVVLLEKDLSVYATVAGGTVVYSRTTVP
jgi:N-acetylglucosamine-6-phosphate deacetylase